MYEAVALLFEYACIGGSHVDDTSMILTETGEVQVTLILQVTLHLLTIIADKTLAVVDHPQTSLAILNHSVDGMEISQSTTYLTGVGLVAELHDAETRCACQHIAILTLKETGSIATARLTLQISHRHMIEGLTIPSLQCSVHSKIKKSVAILHHGIHVVAGEFLVGLVLATEDTELVTVVTVDTVTRRGPDKSIMIEIYLSN